MKTDISEEWVLQNNRIRMMAEKLSIAQFKQSFAKKKINVQFKVISFMTQTTHHTEKLYKNPEQFAYNRYPNIMTFDHTRVILGDETDRQKPQSYINANVIQIDGRKVIACQGPQNNTLLNFWRMIDEQKVTEIYMLCRIIQKNVRKCDLYWPNVEGQQQSFTAGPYKITVEHQDNKINLTTSTLHFLNKENQSQRKITHYKLKNWCDGQKPSPQSEQIILPLLDKFIACLDRVEVPLVHCSAGVGRTGTFIAMGDLKIKIMNKQKISIFETVRKLRQQRWGMVYTSSQYEYLYQFVKNLIDES